MRIMPVSAILRSVQYTFRNVRGCSTCLWVSVYHFLEVGTQVVGEVGNPSYMGIISLPIQLPTLLLSGHHGSLALPLKPDSCYHERAAFDIHLHHVAYTVLCASAALTAAPEI